MDSPFAQVLNELNQVAANVDTLVPPISTLDTAVTDITDVVNDIDQFFAAFNEITIIVDDVRVVALALNVIPVMGEIADALATASTVVDGINDTLKPVKVVVDEVDKVLTTVQTGLNDFKKVIVTISTDIPDTTQTLATLNAILLIGSALVKDLAGTAVSTKLSAIVDKYNDIKNTVSTDIQPVVKALDEITGVIAEFVEEINRIVSDIKGFIGNAVDSVSHAHGVMTPVKIAVDIVHEAMKPVLWLLHAVEWIFDHTVEPVIHEILKLTHINELIDDLEKKLIQYLGINKIISDIEASLSGNKLKRYGAVFDLYNDVSAVAITINNWITVLKVLDEYKQANSSQKPKLLTEAIEDLIKAIVDTPIQLDKITFGGAPPPPPPPANAVRSTTKKPTTSMASITEQSLGGSTTSKQISDANSNLSQIKQIALSVAQGAS